MIRLAVYRLTCLLLLTALPSRAEEKEKEEPKAKETAEPVNRAASLAKALRPAMAAIYPDGRDGRTAGVGTGFVVAADGLIATNLHVIGEARALRVELADGRQPAVTGIHVWDRDLDLAVIRVEARDLTALTLGDSDAVAQGDYAVAMGNPLGYNFSVVEGVVSALHDVDRMRMLQLAIPVEPGNSGGPVLDKDGKVIGIVTLKSATYANLGFAMPVNALRRLLENPAPVAIKQWLTIGTLNARRWQPMGGRWTQRAGIISARGMAEGAFGGRTLCLFQQTPPEIPYEVSVSVRLDDESGAAGLAFCSDGADTHYGFYPSNGGLRLTRFEGPDVNSWTILEQVQSATYKRGGWNHLRVRVEPDRLLCYVNGDLVISSSDASLRSGKAGLAKFRGTEPDFKEWRLGKSGDQKLPETEAMQRLIDTVSKSGAPSADTIAAMARDSATARLLAEKAADDLVKRAAALRHAAQQAHEQAVAAELAALLSKEKPADSDLTRAALQLSRLDNPDVDPEACMEEIDGMAADLMASLSAEEKSAPDRTLAALHRWMFKENGFHGGRDEMQHRSNSYLNEVIADREGLPITLCLVHREFGRRLGLDITGRNFQSRCMNHVRMQGDPPRDVYVDVFDGGKVLTRAEAEAVLMETNGEPSPEETWQPVKPVDVILRMLNNLTASAAEAQDEVRILRYLNTALTIAPDEPGHRLRRLFLHARSGRKAEARADAAWLMEHQPPGMDLDRLREMMEGL